MAIRVLHRNGYLNTNAQEWAKHKSKIWIKSDEITQREVLIKAWSWKVDLESSSSLLLGSVRSQEEKKKIIERSWFMANSRRVRVQCCWWHGTTAHWIRSMRWLFLGPSMKLRPCQKALIKSSSRGRWKVGYQHHCRSSVRPARLHLLNTSSPSPSQTWPRLPKTTPRRNELILYSSYSTVNIYFILVFFFPPEYPSSPGLSPLSCLHYWWRAGTEGCCPLVLYCKVELELLFPFRQAKSL